MQQETVAGLGIILFPPIPCSLSVDPPHPNHNTFPPCRPHCRCWIPLQWISGLISFTCSPALGP